MNKFEQYCNCCHEPLVWNAIETRVCTFCGQKIDNVKTNDKSSLIEIVSPLSVTEMVNNHMSENHMMIQNEEVTEMTEKEYCPECGGLMAWHNGCHGCLGCGYSDRCGL